MGDFRFNVYKDQSKGRYTFNIYINVGDGHLVLQSTEMFTEKEDAERRANFFCRKLNGEV